MRDISDKLISIPTEVLSVILKNSTATYNYDTKRLTYDCLDNNLLPIKIHFPNNQFVQLAYNGITKEANGKCSFQLQTDNYWEGYMDFRLGGYYFKNYCFANRFDSKFGFSKKKEINSDEEKNTFSIKLKQKIEAN